MVKVDVTEMHDFAHKLAMMNKSAFPVAVRQSLDSTGFHLKKKSMPYYADKTFTQRRKNFFKAKSKVDKANGFDIDQMETTVGFLGNEQAVEDLEQQEIGGTIEGRSFVPMESARTGKRNTRPVRPANRLSKIDNIIDARKGKGTNGSKFHRAVHKAGKGGFVLADYKGKTILWRVNSLRKTDTGKHKLTALYSYEEGRGVKVEATHFMNKASHMSRKKMEEFFINHAKRQVEKAFRK